MTNTSAPSRQHPSQRAQPCTACDRAPHPSPVSTDARQKPEPTLPEFSSAMDGRQDSGGDIMCRTSWSSVAAVTTDTPEPAPASPAVDDPVEARVCLKDADPKPIPVVALRSAGRLGEGCTPLRGGGDSMPHQFKRQSSTCRSRVAANSPISPSLCKILSVSLSAQSIRTHD